MSVLHMVAGIAFFWGVVPFCFGELVCFGKSDEIRNDIFFRFIIGFYASVACFTLVCIPMTLSERKFHELKYVYMIVVLLVVFVICLGKIMSKKKYSIKIEKIEIKCWIWIILFSVLFLAQLFRICTRLVMSMDDSVYIPLTNDIIYSDKLLMYDHATGVNFESVWNGRGKYVGSSWYAMMAFWADALGVHVLFLWRTVFPCFFLMLYYLTLFVVSGVFWKGELSKRWMFLFFNGIFMEVKGEKVAMGASWGKFVIKFGCVILLIYILYVICKKESMEMRDSILLLTVTAAGIGMTVMTIMLFPIILGTAAVLDICKRKKTSMLIMAGVASIPIVVEAVVYLMAHFLN